MTAYQRLSMYIVAGAVLLFLLGVFLKLWG